MTSLSMKVVEKCHPGVDRVVCSMPLGTPLVESLEQLDWLAKAVMPAGLASLLVLVWPLRRLPAELLRDAA